MDGDVSVWCVQHRMEVRRDGIRAAHVRHGSTCESKWFTVRRERQVGLESALHELSEREKATR